MKQENTNTLKKERRKIISKAVAGIMGCLLLASLLFAYISFAHMTISPTSSMYPTIKVPAACFGSKIDAANGIERFDIIDVRISAEQAIQIDLKPSGSITKRVIGLGGEKVEIIEGKIYINDSTEPLDEPYLPEDYVPKGNYGPFYVPEGELFLLGDNRDNSFDSRRFEDHFFAEDDVISVLWACVNKEDGISILS